MRCDTKITKHALLLPKKKKKIGTIIEEHIPKIYHQYSDKYKIQTFQSVTFCIITNAPFYTLTQTFHTDLKINTVEEIVKAQDKPIALPTNEPSKSRNISVKFRYHFR